MIFEQLGEPEPFPSFLPLSVRLAQAAAIGSIRQGAPFFRDPPDRVVDGPQPLLQLESVGI